MARWFRNWESTGTSLKPSLDEIVIEGIRLPCNDGHLSLKQENQEMIREVVSEAWPVVVEHLKLFDPATSDDSNLFTNRWRPNVNEQRTSRNPHIFLGTM